MNRQKLETKKDFETLLKRSEGELVVIFKHSIYCGVSSAVFEETRALFRELSTIPLFLLTIQESGDLKLHIANMLGVKHESPQLIIVKNRKSVYDASHYEINPELIRTHLEC